jgi:serine/threonine protein kinase
MYCSKETLSKIDIFERTNAQSFAIRFRRMDKNAIDLLERTICWDSTKRLNASEALDHAFFEELHSLEEEPEADSILDLSDTETHNSLLEWKIEIQNFVLHASQSKSKESVLDKEFEE